MDKFKRGICILSTIVLLVPGITICRTTEAYAAVGGGLLNLEQIKGESINTNSVVDRTLQNIENDRQRVRQDIQQAVDRAAEISKQRQTKISSETQKVEKAVNNIQNTVKSVRKANINTIKSIENKSINSAASSVQNVTNNSVIPAGQVTNKKEIKVDTNVQKPVNVITNILPKVNVSHNTKVNVVNCLNNNNVSIFMPIVRMNSIIINRVPCAIPIPIISFRPIIIKRPSLFGDNIQASVPVSKSLAPSDSVAVVNEPLLAGLPQTGAAVDFYILISSGSMCLLLGIIILGIGKRNSRRQG